tara:strand:+ start:169 stop:561 length:393 start_codon:yes stop_codon:yes gene_type:complete
MAEEQTNTDKHEPAIMVKQSKVLWILVGAILWLTITIMSLPALIEKIIVAENAVLQNIVDHELDDANDNYEKSLNLLLQGKGAQEILEAFQCNISAQELQQIIQKKKKEQLALERTEAEASFSDTGGELK